MPSNYIIRAYRLDPLRTTHVYPVNQAGADGFARLDAVYGPQAHLCGHVSALLGAPEQYVSMSDPDGNNHVSNVGAFSLYVGEFGGSDVLVAYLGLLLPNAISPGRGPGDGFAKAFYPIARITCPGGTQRIPGGGRLNISAGAAVFTLPS